MKKFIFYILISIIIVTVTLGMYKLTRKNYLYILYNNLQWGINQKGILNAQSFDVDENDNIFLAYKNKLVMIDKNKKEQSLLESKEFEIWDIIAIRDKLYIATDHRILEYNLENGVVKELISSLPNFGENSDIKIVAKDKSLFISIGTTTNSGILEERDGVPDVPSFDWIVTGKNYGNPKTGPFVSNGIEVKKGDMINGSRISNGSIISYNIESGKISTYATGLRNIKGLDFNSEGNLVGIVGGMEEEGSRPVKDDKDYIYVIKEKAWYGWPDFSGGDPITSPRFTDGGIKLDFLIQNHITETPFAPKYQHKSVSSLKALAVEKDGKLFTKDTIIFADNKEKYIYALTDNNLLTTIIDLGDNGTIEKIVYKNNRLFVLDSTKGVIYELQGKALVDIFKLPIVIKAFIIILSLIIIIIVAFKIKGKK